MRCFAVFDVTSAALIFEQTLRSAGYGVRLAPVPRSISASCGLACQIPPEEYEAVQSCACEKKLDVSGWHCLED